MRPSCAASGRWPRWSSLLGSLCVLSGISGDVAQIVSGLGLEVSSLRTFRTLRDALRFAVRHVGVA